MVASTREQRETIRAHELLERKEQLAQRLEDQEQQRLLKMSVRGVSLLCAMYCIRVVPLLCAMYCIRGVPLLCAMYCICGVAVLQCAVLYCTVLCCTVLLYSAHRTRVLLHTVHLFLL